MTITSLDTKIINFFDRISVPLARFGLFVIFFWFGTLKLIGVSPATGVVERLFEHTVPFMSFHTFYICFALLEIVIGMLFLVKGAERVVIPLLFIHMATTFGPLFLLPSETWAGFLIPTMEGQYIIKNLALIAAAVGIAAKLTPFKTNTA